MSIGLSQEVLVGVAIIIARENNASLKVSLPPENNSSSPRVPRIGIDESISDDCYTAESSYGSIPQLEASPRRYRTHGEDEFQYDVAGTSLGVPTFLNKTMEKDKKSARQTDQAPPKLPERTSKSGMHSSISPPPLPPKKQASYMPPITSSIVHDSKQEIKNDIISKYLEPSNIQPPIEDDIYDFPPDPTISGAGVLNQKDNKSCVTEILKTKPGITKSHNENETHKRKNTSKHGASMSENEPELPLVTVEELSKMSVMELNEKMMAGHLPSHLKGMSIFELVEYIARQMTCAKVTQATASANNDSDTPLADTNPNSSLGDTFNKTYNGMKPSFSDNFVSVNADNKRLEHEEASKEDDSSLRRYGIPSPINRFRTTDSIHSMSPGPPTTGARLDISDEEGNSGHPKTFDFPSATPSNHILEEEDCTSHPNGMKNFDTPETLKNKTRNDSSENRADKTSKSSSLVRQNSIESSQQENDDSQFDKYAAFRELELEDVQGWSATQSVGEDDEATNDDVLRMIPDNEDDTIGVDDGNHEEEVYLNGESKLSNSDDIVSDQEETKQPPVCSSEGSPSSRSDKSASVRNFNPPFEEDQIIDNYPEGRSNILQSSTFEENTVEVIHKRDSQIPICNVFDEQNEQQEEDTVDQGTEDFENEQEIDHQDCQKSEMTLSENKTPHVEDISKQELKEKFFSSTMDEPSSTRQWTTFDESEPWNSCVAGERRGRRGSFHSSENDSRKFAHFNEQPVGFSHRRPVDNNTNPHSVSKSAYSATLGRQPLGNRRQGASLSSAYYFNSPMEQQQQTFIHEHQRTIIASNGRTIKTNHYPNTTINDGDVDKMHLYFESRGIIPIDQKRILLKEHQHCETIPNDSSTIWPGSHYSSQNNTSLEEGRILSNDSRAVEERKCSRGTPNPFNDNFAPNIAQHDIHGANNIRAPHQQIPQTLHSSSALHMEEAYLQHVSPVYLHHHSGQHNQTLSDAEGFQYCENYSESPRSGFTSQAFRYVEGASHDSSNQDVSIYNVTNPQEHVMPQDENNSYHLNQQPNDITVSQTGSIGSQNEVLNTAGLESSSINDKMRIASLRSPSSHDMNNSTKSRNDDVFRIDQSSLENPTFKVHAKVIPNTLRSESTKLDSRNENIDGESDEFSMTKSDSINIFSIQSDPFDDEFFKF